MKKILLASFFVLMIGVILPLAFLMWCQLPDHDYTLSVPALSESEKASKHQLQKHVTELAGTIGPRNLNRSAKGLAQAEQYIIQQMQQFGYEVSKQDIKVKTDTTANIYAALNTEQAKELLVIGAHYDSFEYSPGADDNASGVAMLLEIARLLKNTKQKKDLVFVFFTNEEEPFYETALMGSTRFVEDILHKESRPYRMINLESVGYFTLNLNSQQYPFPLNLIYYSTGDFIGFVSNLPSRNFLKDVIREFKIGSNFPTGASSLPEFIPGVDWSDHAAFWRANKKAVMITDSTFFRYQHYHLPTDTPDRLDYNAMAYVTSALVTTITAL